MSQDNPPIDAAIVELGKIFLPEWVTEVYYGGTWYPVEPGSYREFESEDGDTYIYQDAFSKEVVILTAQVQGWKVKQPESLEPKATVTPLFPEKK